MIELSFKGEQAQVIQEILNFASTIAGGIRVQQAVNAARESQPPAPANDDAAEEVPAGEEMLEPPAPKRGRPKKVPPTPPEPSILEAMKTEAEAEPEAPAPKNVDEFRELIKAVAAKAGHERAKQIVLKYAAKMSQVPVEKYAEVAADARAAIAAVA